MLELVNPYRSNQPRKPERPIIRAETPRCQAGYLRTGSQIAAEAELIAETLGVDPTDAEPVSSPTNEILGCTACSGTAQLEGNGPHVNAPRCISSGSCELTWATMHADQYRTYGRLAVTMVPCSGFQCEATIDLTQTPPAVMGVCSVDRAGEEFRLHGMDLLNGMTPTDPDVLEPFDGQRLD